MTQEAKGIFLPYPLLAIIATVVIVLVTGLVTLEVQVSNLGTTLLLRDSDTRAQTQATKEKLDTLEVYIHNDREQLIRIATQLDAAPGVPRRR